jgi:hypothetical protein
MTATTTTTTTLPTKSKTTSSPPKGDTILALVIKALVAIRSTKKGVSRQAIASWVLANSDKSAGASFNGWLRRAVAQGLEKNLLSVGETSQRFKLGEAGKSFGKPKKVVKKPTKKKVVSSKKKKTSLKKKKTPKRKTTKTSSKKKPVKKTTKKKTTPKKSAGRSKKQ